jgi:isopentenyl diphosphate isomerase/L-lactate dehydrogenase-like FMN-dependent dehydrogenase
MTHGSEEEVKVKAILATAGAGLLLLACGSQPAATRAGANVVMPEVVVRANMMPEVVVRATALGEVAGLEESDSEVLNQQSRQKEV